MFNHFLALISAQSICVVYFEQQTVLCKLIADKIQLFQHLKSFFFGGGRFYYLNTAFQIRVKLINEKICNQTSFCGEFPS